MSCIRSSPEFYYLNMGSSRLIVHFCSDKIIKTKFYSAEGIVNLMGNP